MCRIMDIKETNLLRVYENKPRGTKSQSFKENNTSDYKDPLKQWPIRGFAYSNELGAAIHGISPTLGTALWIPALMYIGADVYDKYKNDNTSYNPSTKRGTKEAIFQGLASVILPTAAVGIGQKTASSLNRLTDGGLSTQAKIDVLERSLDFVQSNDLNSFDSNSQDYSAKFTKSILQKSDDAKNEFKNLNPIKKIISMLNPFKDSDNITHASKSKLEDYSQKHADKVIRMYGQLMNDEKPEQLPQKLFDNFKKNQIDYAQTSQGGNAKAEAIRTVLKDFHERLILKNKLIKTAGGFIALGLMIKPIDSFVEHFIIKKTVEPGFDYISQYRQRNNFMQNRNIF